MNYLKNCSILTLHSQYTYCLFMFVLQADTFLKEILMLAKITHSVQSGYVELVQDVISDMAACYDP